MTSLLRTYMSVADVADLDALPVSRVNELSSLSMKIARLGCSATKVSAVRVPSRLR